MSLINRPDERRREEARIARASQARPLVEAESAQVVQGDSTFSRVTVPNSQLDDLTKSVKAILGPYRDVLVGPSINGVRIPKVSDQTVTSGGGSSEKISTAGADDETHGGAAARAPSQSAQQQLPPPNQRQSTNSTASTRPSNSSSGEDSKRPLSLVPVTQPQSTSNSSFSPHTLSKPPRQAFLPTPILTSAHSSSLLSSSNSHTSVVTSSSSPLSQSPVKSHVSKDLPTSHGESDASKEVKQRLALQKASVTASDRTRVTALRSPKTKDQHSEQAASNSHNPTKSRHSSSRPPLTSTSSNVQSSNSPTPSQILAQVSSLNSSATNDHKADGGVLVNVTNASSTGPTSAMPVSSNTAQSCHLSPSAAGSSQVSLAPVLIKAEPGARPRPHSSFSSWTHESPSPRPRSTTPTKINAQLPNGIATPHPKLTLAATSSSDNPGHMASTTVALGTSSSSLTDKKSLKVKIPTLKKTPTSKSDLIDFLKDIAELQAPLTAIETPQKVDKAFPFYSASNPLEPRSDLFSDSCKKDSEKTVDGKRDISEGALTIKTDEILQKDQKPTLPGQSASPVLSNPDVSRDLKVEDVAAAESDKKVESEKSRHDANEVLEQAVTCRASNSTGPVHRHRSLGKTISEDNSILMRDLDLSEDSDVEPAAEDNTSACQSKKGKVIDPSAGAPVKKAVSPTSSSNSSSSESSSDSDGEEEDDDDDQEKKENDLNAKKSSERRLSTSSSSSSSESESGSDDGEEDGEIGVKKVADAVEFKTAVERGEKTPSPTYRQSAVMAPSIGTPNTMAQENETSMSWRLDHFIHPKKNSSSPASISPFKSASPPTSHSAPPSVQRKDDPVAKTPDHQRPGTLRDLGHCDTMSFEIPDMKNADSDGDEVVDNNDNDVFKTKARTSALSRNDPEPSLVGKSWKKTADKQLDQRKSKVIAEVENSKKVICTEGQFNSITTPAVHRPVDSKDNESGQRHGSSSSNSKKDKNASPAISAIGGKTKSTTPQGKPALSRFGSSSSSNDEIDVVNFTPDEKLRHRLLTSPDKAVSKKDLLMLPKNLFNGGLSESSDEDFKTSSLRGKGSDILKQKHRRSRANPGDPSSTAASVPNSSEDSIASKISRKDHIVALDQLEAISKPPNLLSPLHSAYPSPHVASTKPLPTFQASFSPLHSSASSMPPYVTLSRNPDGTTRPKIMVQIRHSFLNEKILSWIKKRKRRKEASRASVSETHADALKDVQAPSIPQVKSSQRNFSKCDTRVITPRGGDQSTVPTAAHSMSSHPSKLGKHRSRDGNSNLSSPNGQPTKQVKSSISSSTSSSSEPASSILPSKSTPYDSLTTAAYSSPLPKSNTLTSSSSMPAAKASGSSAVKNLDFTNDKVASPDELKSDKSKPFKRKMDIAEESSGKKTKLESSIEKGGAQPPTNIGKRRDSAASTSSRESHQSSTSKKSRRTPIGAIKDSSNNISTDKANAEMSNGLDCADLPFNHYVNGNSNASSRAPSASSTSVPANLPPPSPIETQLHSHKYYQARAREHKHHADNLRDKLAKLEPYLRSGLSFFLAGYAMEMSERELNTSYTMYSDTSNLLQYVIRMRANSSSNPESGDREKKLIVLFFRLQSFLNHRLYRLRRTEVSKLKKTIESEQSKYHSSATTAPSNTNTTATSKPHAPSPHQSNWSKNSTGTLSPMSPTPSPAGSVSSQGSCEIGTGKIPNGNTSSSSTPLTSPSPSMVSVHHRMHAVTQKYFILTSHMVKALELWDQADAESRGFEDFFSILDSSCGPLSFHSDPLVVVRYMKHALRLLNL